MLPEEMSDKQLVMTIKRAHRNLSEGWKAMSYMNGEMALLSVETDIDRIEDELNYLHDELTKRRKKPKNSQLLIEKWKNKEVNRCQAT